MNYIKKIVYVFSFAVFISDVASWTVNLAEVKKFLASKNQVKQIDEKRDNDDMSMNLKNIKIENDMISNSLNYARSFEYQGYKEKKVNSIISNGSVYLEGLSKALLAYRRTLEKCNKNDTRSEDSSESKQDSCASVSRNSEYVQRLSELALWTTNKLRDQADDQKVKDSESDENNLLLQLAWFLDRLAFLTGYEPNPKDFITTSTEASVDFTTTVPPEVTDLVTEEESIVDSSQLEILESVENGRPMSKLPPKILTPVKTVRKRSADGNDPLQNVMKYYLKYKVWNSSNPVNETGNKIDKYSSFDVENSLKVKPISKRSVYFKKKALNMRVEENKPKLIKQNNYVKDKGQSYKVQFMNTKASNKILKHVTKDVKTYQKLATLKYNKL